MRVRIIMLSALFALAGGAQALAPVSAAAMDDAGTGSGECWPMIGVPGVYWNGTELCTPDNVGSGETGGGSTGGDLGGVVGEVIEVEDVDPCRENPSLCLASQMPSAGAGDQSSDFRFNPRSGRALSPHGQATRLRSLLCRATRGRINRLQSRALMDYRKGYWDHEADPEHNQMFQRVPELDAKIAQVAAEMKVWIRNDCKELGLFPRLP